MLPYLFNLFLLQIVNVGFFPRDTVVFTYDELFLLTCNNDYIIKDETCYYKNRNYRIQEFDSIRKSLNHKIALIGVWENPTYCILLDDKNNKSEEGIWDIECFWGPYKKYFRNGQLEMEGSFANLYETQGCTKINDWKYYNHEGDLIRIETYDKNGRFLKRKNFKWKIKLHKWRNRNKR